MHQKPFRKQKLPFYKKLFYILIGFCVGLVFFNGLRAFHTDKTNFTEDADPAGDEISEEHKATLTENHH